MNTLVNEMRKERQRQIKKWGRQRLSLRVWLWIWLEEVGEYYQAKLELRNACLKFARYENESTRPKDVLAAHMVVLWSDRKQKELVQVLTVMWAFLAEWRPWHGLWRI